MRILIQNNFGRHTNSQSFLTCLFQLNPFLGYIIKENLLGLQQLLYGTMVNTNLYAQWRQGQQGCKGGGGGVQPLLVALQ